MRRFVVVALVALGLLAVAGPAGAATQTFQRFEVDATANYIVAETCPDGSTVQTQVAVIAGHEDESQDGVTTLDSDFLTVLIRGRDCEGNFSSDRGSGPANFSFSESLQEATVSGTITTRLGRMVTVEMIWEGTGAVEATSNTTNFPGFTGHFTSRRRDAVATGTVVVDGETLVDGSTSNAELETLEDNNISHF